MGQIEKPDEDIWCVLNEYYGEDEWHEYLLTTVFYRHPAYVKLLISHQKGRIWNAEIGKMLRSIIQQCPDDVVDILETYGLNNIPSNEAFDVISAIPADISGRAFELRLKLMDGSKSILLSAFEIFDLIRRQSACALPIIERCLSLTSSERSNISMPKTIHIQRFSEKYAH